MRRASEKTKGAMGLRLMILCALTAALASSPVFLRSAITAAPTSASVMAIAVTNNSSREIRHLYLSPVDRNAWGPDLLGETPLRTGQTITLTDVSCGGNEIKVIAEDKDGCFVYGIVGCAEASTGWTITNDNPPDCGN